MRLLNIATNQPTRTFGQGFLNLTLNVCKAVLYHSTFFQIELLFFKPAKLFSRPQRKLAAAERRKSKLWVFITFVILGKHDYGLESDGG